MSAAWPKVQSRLVTLLPGLPGWADVDVSDGPPADWEAPYKYCWVGAVIDGEFGGTYEQTRNGDGGWAGALQETGSVRCELVVCAPAADLTDLAAVRDAAFALVDAWEAAVSGDETLGVLGNLSQSSLAVDVQPMQTDRGAVQRLVVTVSYLTYS